MAGSAGATERLRRLDRVLFVGMAVFAAVALLVSVAELVSLSLAARAIVRGHPGLEAASHWSPLNWNYRFVLGEVAAAAGRPELAVEWYREAIARNPACAQCAVGLAEVESRLGRDPDPWLDRAIHYGRSTASIRVRVGTLYARLGRQDEAAREFSAAALGQRENQREFFSLLHRIYPDDVVLDRIIPDEIIPSYFAFGRSALGPSAVQRIWHRYEGLGLGATGRDQYVSYLLRHGLAHEAWSIRFEGSAPPLGRLLNGDFEEVTTNTGFSWRVADGDGVTARVVDCPDCVDRGRALLLEFDGETNAHYTGTRVYIAVKPLAVYRLAARVKADGITSARGPMLVVAGLRGSQTAPSHACELWVPGEELEGTFDWRSSSLLFRVPEACEGVQMLVARLRTKRLDKFIGGELWVDDVVLEEMISSTGPAATEPAEEGAQRGSVGVVIGAVTAPAAAAQPEVETIPGQ